MRWLGSFTNTTFRKHRKLIFKMTWLSMSSHSSEDRAPARYSGVMGSNPIRTQIFSRSHARVKLLSHIFTELQFHHHSFILIFPHRDFIICRVSLAIFHPHFSIGILSSAFFYPPSTIRHPPSAIRHPPSAIRHPPSAIRHPPSAIRHPPSAIRHPPSAIRHPPSAIRHPVYRDPRLGFIP